MTNKCCCTIGLTWFFEKIFSTKKNASEGGMIGNKFVALAGMIISLILFTNS